MMSSRQAFSVATLSLISTLVAASNALAIPQINNISQYGVQISQPTLVYFDGSELAPDAKVISSLPIRTQKIVEGAAPNRVGIEITIDDAAQPGVYTLRIASAAGISNPVLIAVDRLPQATFAEETKSLPIALSGSLSGSEVKRTTFVGTKGQRVMIDVEAQRIGGNFKPIVRLYDSRGRQLAGETSQPWWGGDCRCSAVLSENGKYTVELSDRQFRAGGPGIFRLKLGDFQTADRVHPAAFNSITAGQTKLSFFGGNVPKDAFGDVSTTGNIKSQQRAIFPQLPLVAGPQPSVLVSDHAEAVESPVVNGAVQEVAAPSVGINGILSATGEEDRYLFPVTANQKIRIDVFARRLGSPVDAVLSLRNEQGGQLVGADDAPASLDPMIAEFVVPANTAKLMVAVKDLIGRGGPEMNYRIAITDLAQPDFSLSVATDRINIPAGGTQTVPVQVVRQGYAGPIKLDLRGLPTNIQVAGNEIAAGSSQGLVSLTAAAGPRDAGLITVAAESVGTPAAMVRLAQIPEFSGTRLAPYHRNHLGWGVSPALPISITWALASDRLLQGTPLPVDAQVIRAAGTVGNIRLRLMTTQPTITKKIKENNQDKEVVDLARTLRLASDVSLPPDQLATKSSIFVPGDLPAGTIDVVLVAELLAADGMNVVSTAYTPVKRLNVVAPIALALTSDANAAGKAGAGEAGKFTGKIARAEGFAKPVLVTLTGLPAGYLAPVVQVPASATDFTFELRFPFGTPPADLKNLQLIAATDVSDPYSQRSAPVAVNVNLTAGEKPVAEAPKELFDEDEKFFAALTEGGGKIENHGEKQTGKIAVRVTPDQKYAARIPGLEAKIRENPGPGEFRYLRFAWRKAGGNSICLQLAHDGEFGPTTNAASGREGAKFRYHAGPAGECYGGSVTIDGNLPGGYVVVTRDLFADFGEFTLTGLGLSAVNGEAAWFDGLYLGRTANDFGEIK